MVKDGIGYIPKGAVIKVSLYVPDAPWESQELCWADKSDKDLNTLDLMNWINWMSALFGVAFIRGLEMHYPDMKADNPPTPPDETAQKATEQKIICEGHRPK